MKRNKLSAHNPTNISYPNYFLYLLLAACSLQAVAADSSSEARRLINDMSRATNELNYDGDFVYSRGQRIDTMRLIHRSDSDGVFERMISLSGNTREVIRNQKGVTCIFSDNQEVMFEKSRPRKFLSTQLPEPVEKIAEYYNFTVAGADRVAGRQATVVNVIPKDGYRYGYQLWVDDDSKLLLKSVLKNQGGRNIEQVMFTRLELLDSVPDELLEPQLDGKNYVWHENDYDDISVEHTKSEWALGWMPQGFNKTEHEKQTSSDSSSPMDHLIYSDGLAMVSVFIEKLEDNHDFAPGPASMGGVNAFTVAFDGHQVTVVGEVPRSTVQQMARSVARQVK